MIIRIIFTILLLLPGIATAEVDPTNGNFVISYKDFGGDDIDLIRTYNSQSDKNGWFGYGWGTPFETHLVVLPDGSVEVQENGSGHIARYFSRGEGRVLRSGNQIQLPTGGIAESNECEEAAVTRLNDEYQRTLCGKGFAYFDLAGRFIRYERAGYRLIVHYAGKYPDRSEDSLGNKLFFAWTPTGHISQTRTGKAAPVINYLYDKKGNLIQSNELGGNYYKYEYDTKHNMTRVGYVDNTHMDMKYDEKNRIISVTLTDGSQAKYSYQAKTTGAHAAYMENIGEFKSETASQLAELENISEISEQISISEEAIRDIMKELEPLSMEVVKTEKNLIQRKADLKENGEVYNKTVDEYEAECVDKAKKKSSDQYFKCKKQYSWLEDQRQTLNTESYALKDATEKLHKKEERKYELRESRDRLSKQIEENESAKRSKADSFVKRYNNLIMGNAFAVYVGINIETKKCTKKMEAKSLYYDVKLKALEAYQCLKSAVDDLNR
jgi:YD repeat-containing protein